jgi:hypothetical protein
MSVNNILVKVALSLVVPVLVSIWIGIFKLETKEWYHLMKRARMQAGYTKEKARVQGFRVGRHKNKWLYVVTCPSNCMICNK